MRAKTDIETFQNSEDSVWNTVLDDAKDITDDTSTSPVSVQKSASPNQIATNANAKTKEKNKAKNKAKNKTIQEEPHDSLIKKVDQVKQHYAQAKHHQQKESAYARAHEQVIQLLKHHTHNAKKHQKMQQNMKHKVDHHEKLITSLESKPSPSHATHQRANEHDLKTHQFQLNLHKSNESHQQRQANSHVKKVHHYTKVAKDHMKKKQYHTKQKQKFLHEGHNTGHFAYPDHYTHHHPGHYNEWDVLHDRSERIRHAQDIRNNVPFAIHEIDPEHSNGFILEQPTSYDNTVPHQHLQQYGHHDYPESMWSTPQTDSPVCLPAVEMERKPIHLGNTYATPKDDFSVGYLMPRFQYQEFREY